MILGAANRDRLKIIMPEGVFELWAVERYYRLNERRVALIDCITSKTYDLCHIAKCREVRKKMEDESI